MNELTDHELLELQQECLDKLCLHPMVIRVYEKVRRELDKRLQSAYIY